MNDETPKILPPGFFFLVREASDAQLVQSDLVDRREGLGQVEMHVFRAVIPIRIARLSVLLHRYDLFDLSVCERWFCWNLCGPFKLADWEGRQSNQTIRPQIQSRKLEAYYNRQ